MAWYLRKAFRLGPLLRLNISKSGLGASFGIPGLRIGTGPRGAYLHAGRGGLYYRQSLSSRRGQLAPSPQVEAIDSAEVEQLSSAETEDSLIAYNDVLARSALTPWILILAGVCGAVFFVTEASASWMWTGVAFLLVLLLAIAVPRDRARLHYAVEYELTPDQASAYDRLGQAFDAVAGCARVWHVAAEGSTGDRRKYHAGAGSLVHRAVIRPTRTRPRRLRSALTFPTLEAGTQTLHFMPDCLLVLEGRRAGTLGYSDMRGHTSTTRFIENSDPPSDSRVVGQTWEYVNKDGGPDRRFASNRELAVCEYGRLRLASDAGLTEEFHTSRADVFPAFIAAVRGMAQVAPHEERPPEPTAAAPSRFKTRAEYEAWKAERLRQQQSGTQGEPAKLAGRSREPGGWPGDKVPRSRQELEQVRVQRPGGWEFLYFAGILRLELEESKDKYLDHELKHAPALGQGVERSVLVSFLSDSMNSFLALLSSLGSMMTTELQESAFGPPGVPGNPERIQQLADSWNSVYVGFLDWSARVRGTRRSREFDRAFEIMAQFANRPIEEYRTFVNEFVAQADKIPAAIASKTPRNVELTLTLTADHSLIDEFTREFKRLASQPPLP